MMIRIVQMAFLSCACVFLISCSQPNEVKTTQPVYKDVAFLQDYSVKYTVTDESIQLKKVYSDRNGVIQVLSSGGLLKTFNGQFLYPGTLVSDKTYRPIADKKIQALNRYKDHFVYADDKAVLANAWAGNLYSRHTLPTATLLEGGNDFDFLISDGNRLQYLSDSTVVWEGKSTSPVLDIQFDKKENVFLL
jgi:hypothetical protein